jgi:serine/threonine protein kinase
MLEGAVTPGTQVGSYRIGRELGRGGMGAVFEAVHLETNEAVAVKFLTDERRNADPAVFARFVREARATSTLATSHVAKVLTTGVAEGGVPYLVMELLHGSDLEKMVRERGPLPIPEAMAYVIEACAGIADAHANGILHRDLKPANLFHARIAGGSAVIKVLDFGLAKYARELDAAATASQLVFGTPQYASPEQLTSTTNVDARADVWSLGAIAFELVTGRPAFPGPSVAHVIAKVMNDAPERLCHVRLDAPPELEAVIMRALEKDRSKRYGSVTELARALAPFAPREYVPLVAALPLADLAVTPRSRLADPTLPQVVAAPAPAVPGPPTLAAVGNAGAPVFDEPGVAWNAKARSTPPARPKKSMQTVVFVAGGIACVGLGLAVARIEATRARSAAKPTDAIVLTSASTAPVASVAPPAVPPPAEDSTATAPSDVPAAASSSAKSTVGRAHGSAPTARPAKPPGNAAVPPNPFPASNASSKPDPFERW